MRLGLLSIDSLDEPHRSIDGDYGERFTALFTAAGATLEMHDGRGPRRSAAGSSKPRSGGTSAPSTTTCPIAGYTIGDQVSCVQVHPEFDAPVARSLYRSRVERIGAGPVEAALATLARPLSG